MKLSIPPWSRRRPKPARAADARSCERADVSAVAGVVLDVVEVEHVDSSLARRPHGASPARRPQSRRVPRSQRCGCLRRRGSRPRIRHEQVQLSAVFGRRSSVRRRRRKSRLSICINLSRSVIGWRTLGYPASDAGCRSRENGVSPSVFATGRTQAADGCEVSTDNPPSDVRMRGPHQRGAAIKLRAKPVRAEKAGLILLTWKGQSDASAAVHRLRES